VCLCRHHSSRLVVCPIDLPKSACFNCSNLDSSNKILIEQYISPSLVGSSLPAERRLGPGRQAVGADQPGWWPDGAGSLPVPVLYKQIHKACDQCRSARQEKTGLFLIRPTRFISQLSCIELYVSVVQIWQEPPLNLHESK
jgi:hypothetical protein